MCYVRTYAKKNHLCERAPASCCLNFSRETTFFKYYGFVCGFCYAAAFFSLHKRPRANCKHSLQFGKMRGLLELLLDGHKANSIARPQTDVRFVRILSVWVGVWGRVRACPGMRWPCAQRAAASICPILSAYISLQVLKLFLSFIFGT